MIPPWAFSLLKNRTVQIALLFVVFLGVLAFLWGALREAREDLGACKANVMTCRADVESAVLVNDDARRQIFDLRAQIQKMVDERAIERARMDAELAARDRRLLEAQTESKRLREQMRAAWGVSNDCSALGRVDLARVCPDVTARLRERSAAGSRPH